MSKMIQRVLLTGVLILATACTVMSAQRHWVGSGTGNGRFWDKPANWSLTQGGAGGAGIPTASDDVFIDGGGALQINTLAVCLSYTQSVSSGTKDFTNNSTLTVGAGGFTITGGALSITTTGNIITVAGNWTQSGGSFSPGTASVILNGTSTQTITGTTSFSNLTINNAAGAALAQNDTVTTALTLTLGAFSTGSSKLVIPTGATVTRTAGWVNGNLQMAVATGATSVTFHTGDASNYTPVAVAFASVTTAGNLTANSTAGEHPNIIGAPINGSKSVNRYYTLTNGGVVFTTYSATFTFVAGDVDAGANTANFIVGKYNSPTWTQPTVGTKTATSTQATGVTSFSDFAIGEPVSLTISASAGANGTISPSGSVGVSYGGNQSFTITANANYHVADVLVDGVSQGPVASYSFTSVVVNHTISATFAINTFTITASAGAHGSISPSGPVVVNYGADTSFTITPATGYHIADVTVDGSSIGAVASHTFTSVSANHTIAATFAINTYTITASAGANGSISPSGGVVVNYGSDTTFTITPATGYHVADVTVDGSSIGAVTTHTFTSVSANHTIAATFAINTYTITASAGANGSISPSGGIVVNYGSDTSFTITAATGYHIADVTVDGSSIGAVASHSFTSVSANHTIAASFAIDTLTITASAGANGSISPSGAVAVVYGSDQPFTITPAIGYHVADVLVDGSSVGAVASHTFTSVTANHTISASFAIDTLTITASAGANGSISPSGAVTVLYGSDQGFTITPSTGYHVADVLVDGSSIGAVASHTFTSVTTNHTISASFAIDTLTVSASAGAGGSISPSGAVGVLYGSDQGFTITPSAGYHVSDVSVDGTSIGAAAKYTFTNVTANHTIAASFAIDTLTITASAGANGSISPSGAVGVLYGSDQGFTITPATGHHVSDVSVDGTSIGAVAKYTFTNVTANHTIAASFAIDTLTVTATAGANGSISPSGAVSVLYGSDQGFMITPASGYHVLDVTVDGTPLGALAKYTFTNVTANHTISASFSINQFAIKAIADAHGTISPSGVVLVDSGASQSFTITPDTGYFISDVRVDSVSVGAVAKYTFTGVAGAHVIEATFAIQTFIVKGIADAHGSISPSGAVPVDYGSNQTFTITPDTGYYVSDVRVDSVSVGAVAKYTFTNVTATHVIEASFAIQSFIVKGIADAHGSISPSGAVPVNYGSSQSFTITPDTGYLISDVKVDSVSVGAVAKYTLTNVTANHVIEASFAIQSFIVKGVADAHGSISPSGPVPVNYGSSQSFTITPDTGYLISDVKVDSVSVGAVAKYSFTNVTASHVIEASFVIQSFTITATAGAHGTVSPSGSVPVTYGSSQMFTITPDSAYFVSDVLVDSVSVGAVTKYTFSNVSANHTIEASFSTNPLPVLKTVSPSSAYRGETVDLVFTGTNFVSGVSTLNAGAGITVKTMIVHTSDSIFATVTVGAGTMNTGKAGAGAVGTAALPGNRVFTVTNSPPGGGTSGPVNFTVLNHPPAAFHLANPVAGDTIRLKSPSVPIEFTWHPSSDLDGADTLRYIVRLIDPLSDTIAVTTDTSVSAASLMALLKVQTWYSWSVWVTDGFDTVSADTFLFRTSDSVSSVAEKGKGIPVEYALRQNYPNPFNPSTTIEFDLPRRSVVRLVVYNLLGQEVATLIDGQLMEAGYQRARFDASRMPSGVYLYRLSAEGPDSKSFVRVLKMMMLR